jgi:molecular chaperone GrpE
MERAIAAFRNDNLDSTYIDGVDMIYKQLYAILEKNGLKEIEAAGQEFDPNIHHAVMQVEGDAEEENKVKMVLQKGYYLGSKVVRPAMVQVVVNS